MLLSITFACLYKIIFLKIVKVTQVLIPAYFVSFIIWMLYHLFVFTDPCKDNCFTYFQFVKLYSNTLLSGDNNVLY